METAKQQGAGTRARVVVALLAGLIVFVLLFQWGGGNEPIPPTCFGMFGWYTVPCGGWPAVAAGALTAGVVGLVLWWWDRRT
jgi:hypothetical protein